MVSYLGRTRWWAAHGRYLAHGGATPEGAEGRGFDADRQDVDLAATLQGWQKAGDIRVWTIVVSPEHSARLDLRPHTRALVEQMQSDLGTPLEWAAIEHHDTDHPHVHVVVRGRDARGGPLELSPSYFMGGLQVRSQELATRVLGFRSEREHLAARGRTVDRVRFTEIDRALVERADQSRLVSYGESPGSEGGDMARAQEVRRLEFLEGLGLVRRVDARTWHLPPAFETSLRRAERRAGRRRARTRRAELPAPPAEVRGAKTVEVGHALGRDREGRDQGRLPVTETTVEADRATTGPADRSGRPSRRREPASPPLPKTTTLISGRAVPILRPAEGQVYRGRLFGYARGEDGQRYAVIDSGRELAALGTDGPDLPRGRPIRATVGEAQRDGRGELLWRLRDDERGSGRELL